VPVGLEIENDTEFYHRDRMMSTRINDEKVNVKMRYQRC